MKPYIHLSTKSHIFFIICFVTYFLSFLKSFISVENKYVETFIQLIRVAQWDIYMGQPQNK